MNFQLTRQIIKEIRFLSRYEPNLALRLKENVKIHLNHYYSNRPLLEKKVKKLQKDDELPRALLRNLKEANILNTFNSFRCKIKLIEMYTGISPYLDSQCFFKKGKPSIQMTILEKNKQFAGLPTEKDKQFVRGVIKRLFLGEERYEYKNLTQFFFQIKYESTLQFGQKTLSLLSPDMKCYVQQTMKGETKGVSDEYVKIYRYMFSSEENDNYQTIMQSYLKSRYILVDFEDTKQRK